MFLTGRNGLSLTEIKPEIVRGMLWRNDLKPSSRLSHPLSTLAAFPHRKAPKSRLAE